MINYIKTNFKRILLDIFVFAFSLIITYAYVISKQINNLDEIWNFNTARQIMNGLMPYKEISMITTPLLPTLNAVFLKIFGDELFVFRILTAVILSIILFLVYKIIGELLKNNKIAIISLEGILLLYITYFYHDYNFFSLLLLLLIELIEIKLCESRNSNIKHLFIGIIAGLAICTKQTIGVFIAIFSVILPLINDRQVQIKNRIKNSIFRILGICIPVTIFIIILIITNSLADFIDYAILGIKTFQNSISYKLLFKNQRIYIRILAVTIPIFVIAMTIFELIYVLSKKLGKKASISKINILIFYSFPMLITIYPIADNVHFLIASMPIIILILYIFFKAITEIYEKINLKSKTYISNLIQFSVIIILAIIIVKPILSDYKEYTESVKTNIAHYDKLLLNENIANSIEILKEFHNNAGKKVILADAAAAIYDIPLDIYNKNYDMFLKGNIGKDGEDGIIRDIQNNENCIYLIRKENIPANWQTPTNVIRYIRENWKKVDEIEIFDVYITN